MKRKSKPVFFVVALLIFALAYTAFFGIYTEYGDIETTIIKGAKDIRLGLDIAGGMDVTFAPPENISLTDEELQASAEVMKRRLVNMGITDYEVLIDYEQDRIIVRFPWETGNRFSKPEKTLQSLGTAAQIVFREGKERDEDGAPTGITATNIILTNDDIQYAMPTGQNNSSGQMTYAIEIHLTKEGIAKLEEATSSLTGSSISIWLDGIMISSQTITTTVTDGIVVIPAGTSADDAVDLSMQANSGALPCAFTVLTAGTYSPAAENSNVISVIIKAGAVTFLAMCLIFILKYRAVGLAASIAMLGQLAFTVGFVSGYFPVFNSFTLTLPGIVGITLSLALGLIANIVLAERIREELLNDKSLKNAISIGFTKMLPPVLNGCVLAGLIATLAVGAFTPKGGFFASLVKPIFFAFNGATAGMIYSFGITFLMGLLATLIMSVIAVRLMIHSLSQFEALNNAWMYGGTKNEAK